MAYSTQASSSYDASLDDYFVDPMHTLAGIGTCRTIRATPPATAKYALYQSGGEFCCGHYDHGAPMPLRIRAQIFLEKIGKPIAYVTLITKLVKSNVRKDERYLKSCPLNDESSEVMESFYRYSEFFGIFNIRPSQTARVVVSDLTLDEMLAPGSLGGKPTPVENTPVILAECLLNWRDSQNKPNLLGPLPAPIQFGSVSFSITEPEPTSPKPPITLTPTAPAKIADVKVVSLEDFEDTEEQLEDYISKVVAMDAPQCLEHYEDERVPKPTRDFLRRAVTNPEVSFRFKARQQHLVLTSRPKAVLDYLDAGQESTVPNLIPGQAILAAPGFGKTEWLKAKGLSDIVLDTDLLGRIDATEFQDLLNTGLVIVTNRLDLCQTLQPDQLVVVGYTDVNETLAAMTAKLTGSRIAKLKVAAQEYQKFVDNTKSDVVELEIGEYLSFKHDDIHRLMSKRFQVSVLPRPSVKLKTPKKGRVRKDSKID